MRDKIEFTTSFTLLDAHRIEFTTTHKFRGNVTKVQRVLVDCREQGVRNALIALGWTPPTEDHPPSGSELRQIDDALVQIAGSAPQSPMLSWQGDGRILIGGIVDAKQLAALTALASRFGGVKCN